jgi:hypothetical protein
MSNALNTADPKQLSPADRLRLIHDYITSTVQDGGLGIVPNSTDWDRVESVMTLHDRDFNEKWIHSWTTRQLASMKLGQIREQVFYSFFSIPIFPVEITQHASLGTP